MLSVAQSSYNTQTNWYYTHAFSIGSGGTLQVATQDYGCSVATGFTGNGVYQKTGPGTWDLMIPGNTNNPTTMAMSQGGLIDVRTGRAPTGKRPQPNLDQQPGSFGGRQRRLLRTLGLRRRLRRTR